MTLDDLFGAEPSALSDVRLQALFEAQCASTPDAPALRWEGGSLTYAELLAHVHALSEQLAAVPVRQGNVVAVLFERSPEMIVAILAALRTGAAYLPFDSAYPDARLQFMVDDASPAVVIGSPDQLRRIAPATALEYELPSGMVAQAASPPAPAVEPSDPAYVIYTSGSTGTPKGAVNAQPGVVNRLVWMQRTYRLVPGDRVLQKTSIAFDVSAWEVLWPLLTGATLVLARPGAQGDDEYLAHVIEHEQITVMHFVPSMLEAFLQSDRDLAAACASLRMVVCSGEALRTTTVHRFFERIPTSALENLYGPTEAAIDVSRFACTPALRGDIAPIGRAIDNIVLRVEDERGVEVPNGDPGELCIYGVGVALGYLDRPDLTASRFELPSWDRVEARKYRTGDRARVGVAGELEYLGRMDTQVKIRGNRVELSEIEHTLMSVAEVREVAVLFSEQRGLRAFFTADAGVAVDAETVRADMARRLPPYEVPAILVPLSAMPLSSNGKLDRNALDSLAGRRANGGSSPKSSAAAVVLQAWTEALGRPVEAEPEDTFFELGGDSLSMLTVRRLVERDTGEAFSLETLYQHASLGAMAALVEQHRPS